MVKDIICLIQGRNLFDLNEYLFGPKIFWLNQTNFVSLKQNISLHQRKCFKQIIFLVQSNLFSQCTFVKTVFFTQGVSKRKDLMKISKVIFHIKLIPSH